MLRVDVVVNGGELTLRMSAHSLANNLAHLLAVLHRVVLTNLHVVEVLHRVPALDEGQVFVNLRSVSLCITDGFGDFLLTALGFQSCDNLLLVHAQLAAIVQGSLLPILADALSEVSAA